MVDASYGAIVPTPRCAEFFCLLLFIFAHSRSQNSPLSPMYLLPLSPCDACCSPGSVVRSWSWCHVKFGAKYIFQSMPRLLTLWFQVGCHVILRRDDTMGERLATRLCGFMHMADGSRRMEAFRRGGGTLLPYMLRAGRRGKAETSVEQRMKDETKGDMDECPAWNQPTYLVFDLVFGVSWILMLMTPIRSCPSLTRNLNHPHSYRSVVHANFFSKREKKRVCSFSFHWLVSGAAVTC